MDEEENIKKILHEASFEVSDEVLKDNLTEMKYLVEIWLNLLEEEIFGGKTLQELLSSSDI